MMTVLYYLVLIVQVISSLLMIGVVLLQKPKGQGMGMAFGAGMGETLFGSQVGNVLTRATIILASVFMASTIALTFMGRKAPVDEVTSKMKAPAPATAPALPGGAPMGPITETAPIPAGDMPEAPAAPDAGKMDVTLPVTGGDAPAAAMPVTLSPTPAPADATPAPPVAPADAPAKKE